jgi:2-keto-4-pentenoate hydratase/2-oxohepta-3-ene-1,7-dioic acid hydratase in catechol pathway
MKLVTFEYQNQTFVGALVEGGVINFNRLLNSPDLTMLDLIQKGLAFVKTLEMKVQSLDNQVDENIVLPVSEVTIKAPLSIPGKVVCVGNNYMDHCREQNVEPPKSPMIFSKWSSCIVGPNETVILPKSSKQVDYEAELAVVIGKEGKHIYNEDVYDHIFGYMIINDISARDIQFADGQWVRGKSFDTFAPCGPYLVTADEIENPQNLDIKLTLNQEVVQNSNTKEMIFDIKELISYLSKGFAFMPGDIIATGTPHGVGVFREPQLFLQHGDRMTIEIEGLGSLTNVCKSEVKLTVSNL